MLADGVKALARAREPRPSRISRLASASDRGAVRDGQSTSAATLQELARIRESFIPC